MAIAEFAIRGSYFCDLWIRDLRICDLRTCDLQTQFFLAYLKVHKNENFFGYDFEFFTISLLAMLKYEGFVKKILIGPLLGEIRLFRLV